MELLKEILTCVFLIGGFFFLMVSVIGILRLPEVYTRLHAAGKCDTLGTGLMLLGLILLVGDFVIAVKLAVIGAIVAIINPVVTHLIAKTAYVRDIWLAEGSFFIDDYNKESMAERKEE